MKFTEAVDSYIADLTKPRRRGVLSFSTQRIYSAYTSQLAAHFGNTEMAEVRNGKVKSYIESLRAEGYAPATVIGIFKVLKAIIGSVRDANGARLYSANLQDLTDLDFINLPILDKKEQACASALDVEKAIAANLPIVAFLACTGLRISETLALSVGTEGDSYDPSTDTVYIRRTLKTKAAARSVILPAAFATWFASFVPASGKLFTTTYQQLHETLQHRALPCPHAYRRFRVTHLRKAGMQEDVLRAQLGHSKKSITDSYSFAASDEKFLRSQIEMAGLGFTLPVEAANAKQVA